MKKRTPLSTPWLATATMALMMMACAPEEQPARIDSVSPRPASQEKTLTIYGSGFGAYLDGVTGVTIAGACAPVLLWEDGRIQVQVPPGVGTGVRMLGVYARDLSALFESVEVAGPDLLAPIEGVCSFAPTVVLPDGATPDTSVPTNPGHDTGGPMDSWDAPPQPDTSPIWDTAPPPPDIVPCPLAASNGACVNTYDCQVIEADPMKPLYATHECAFECFWTNEPIECTYTCTEAVVNLSSDCAMCYADTAVCAQGACYFECIALEDPACGACIARNCAEIFTSCSGLIDGVLP